MKRRVGSSSATLHMNSPRSENDSASSSATLQTNPAEPHLLKRHVRLTVLQHPVFEPRTDVPATRAQCPVERPCPHVRCRANLYRSDQPPGRPSLAAVPRTSRGRTVSVVGDLAAGAGNPPRLDSRAPWLNGLPSCALDVAGSGLHTNTELGAVMGLHRTGVALLVKAALRAYRDRGGTAAGLQQLSGGEMESPTGNLASAQDYGTPNSPVQTDNESSSECGVQHKEFRTP